MIPVTVMRDDRHTMSSCYGSKLDFPGQLETAMFGYGRIPRRGKRGERSIIFVPKGPARPDEPWNCSVTMRQASLEVWFLLYSRSIPCY